MKLIVVLSVLILTLLSGCKRYQPLTPEQSFENRYNPVCYRGKVYLEARTHMGWYVPVYTGEPCGKEKK